VSFIRREIHRENDLRTAIENLMDHCLARKQDKGSIGRDNMTVVIIAILNGKTPEQWYEWIAKQYEANIGPTYNENPDYTEEQDSLGYNESFDDVEIDDKYFNFGDNELDIQGIYF